MFQSRICTIQAKAIILLLRIPLYCRKRKDWRSFMNKKNGLRTVVVTTEQVFNEFSGGVPDPTAIRDFVKMYYDKYRSNWSAAGKYLLLVWARLISIIRTGLKQIPTLFRGMKVKLHLIRLPLILLMIFLVF